MLKNGTIEGRLMCVDENSMISPCHYLIPYRYYDFHWNFGKDYPNKEDFLVISYVNDKYMYDIAEDHHDGVELSTCVNRESGNKVVFWAELPALDDRKIWWIDDKLVRPANGNPVLVWYVHDSSDGEDHWAYRVIAKYSPSDNVYYFEEYGRRYELDKEVKYWIPLMEPDEVVKKMITP